MQAQQQRKKGQGAGAKAKRVAKAALKAAGGVEGLARKIDALATKVASDRPGPVERICRKVGGGFGFAGLGGGVGKALGRLVGSGDYHFDGVVNSLMKPGSERSISTHITGFADPARRNVIRVRKVEFLKNILSSNSGGAFKCESIRFNPGNPFFPWLSSSAALGYEKYRVLGAVVYMKTAASEYAAISSLGTWGVAFDYNSTDSKYSSKMEAEQSEGAQAAKVSVDVVAGIECAPADTVQETKIIRFGPPPTALNLTQTDHCTIQVFSQGIQGTNVYLGELWIAYDIELFTQELNGGIMGNGGYSAQWMNTGSSATPTNPFTTTTGQAGAFTGNIDFTISGSTVYLPDWLQGTFFVEYTVWWGGPVSATAPNLTYSGNGAQITTVTANQASYAFGTPVGTGTATNNVTAFMFVRIQAPTTSTTNILSFAGGTLPGSQTLTRFSISQLPDSIVGSATQNWGATPSTSNGGQFWSQ